MGRGDNRLTKKVKQKRAQAKKKEALKRRIEEGKAKKNGNE